MLKNNSGPLAEPWNTPQLNKELLEFQIYVLIVNASLLMLLWSCMFLLRS